MALLQARVTEEHRWRHRSLVKDIESGSMSIGSGGQKQQKRWKLDHKETDRDRETNRKDIHTLVKHCA